MERLCVILLVEDNVNDEVLALRALDGSSVACRIEIARDGIEAIEYLLDSGKEIPDLVLLDLKLPRLNGLEVLRRIRSNERTRRIPVVVLTSSDEYSDRVGCFDSGANSYVRKSVDYDTYTDRVAKIVEYWLTINESCKGAVSSLGLEIASAILE